MRLLIITALVLVVTAQPPEFRGLDPRGGPNANCPGHYPHPTNRSLFVVVDYGGNGRSMACNPLTLEYQPANCSCDWSEETQAHVGCEFEFEAVPGLTKDTQSPVYLQWSSTEGDFIIRNCDELLPDCAKFKGLLFFNFTVCQCDYTSVFAQQPGLLHCLQPDDNSACHHQVITKFNTPVVENEEGTYIDNFIPGFLGAWPILLVNVPDAGVPEGIAARIDDNYIRDAMLPGNSGPALEIYCSFKPDPLPGSDAFIVMADGCIHANGSFIPNSFEVRLQVAFGVIVFMEATIDGEDFRCSVPTISPSWIHVKVAFCKGTLTISVNDADCLSQNQVQHGELLTFNGDCPFLLGANPIPPAPKYRGLIADFRVDRECDQPCTRTP